MSSLPYSILTKEDNDILPLLSINDHQKFCKSLLKSYQSYKKKIEEKTDKYKYKSEEEFLQTQKKQSQEEILKWFEGLTEYQRIKICTIKNKWLVNIFIQLYLIYKTYDTCYIKPILEMEALFQDQNNFSHGNEESKNQLINNSLNQYYNNYDKKRNFFPDDLNFYENFFTMECEGINYNMFDKKETEKREKEKKLIDNIKLLSLEENTIDTLTLNRDIIANFKEIKEFLKYFSDDKYFQDWLLPIKVDNIYNFVLPQWMHHNSHLTLFQLIIGYIEQQILLNYEYYYYSKKIYDYSYSNSIIDLYEENKKLVSFVKENYSFYNHNDTSKREFISLMEIREIVRNIKKSKNYEKKINNLQKIYNYVYNNEFIAENKNCMLNIDFDTQIYQDLYKESMLGGELGIMKVLNHITFMQFNDVVNARDNLFTALREKFVENQNQKIINELISDDYLASNSNKKKNKNKKKKKKNKNNENNSNNNKKKEDIKETSENDNISINNNIEKGKDLNISNDLKDNNNKEINEFNLNEQKSIENKNNDINNIQNNIKEDIIININNEEKNNILKNNEKSDLNIFINENNNQKNFENEISINNNPNDREEDQKEISINNNPKDKEEDQKEELKIEENKNIIKKKSKKKDFFLFPTNIKKNKKNKNLHSLSAKKNQEKKDNNNPIEEDKKELKINSPSPKYNKDKDKKINLFNYPNISLEIKKNNQEKNFGKTISPSPLMAQSQSFSFYKNIDEPPKITDLTISNDNNKKSLNLNFEDAKITNDNITNINITNDINNTNINNSNNNINNPNNINNSNDNNNYLTNFSNIPIISNYYSQYTPSEKFFESLTKEISNYVQITTRNITNLNQIHLKYLSEIENLIKNGLESKYDIKFGHYGSHFTDLSIEGSDLDILINYKPKNNENNNDFFKEILSLLNLNENKFDLIKPILTASVPVIKLQIDIKNEINDIKLKPMPYFEDDNELTKIHFDLTFTQNETEYQHSNQIVSYINQSLLSLPIMKSLLLVLKRYFKIMKMNKSFHGGLSSYSLYLLIYTFCKKCPVSISSPGKALYSFLGFFSFFQFHKYGIDVRNLGIYVLNNNNISNDSNNEEEIIKKEINIIDPLTKLNVAKSSFKVEEIQNTFFSAYDFLRREGCYYDYTVLFNKTEYENDYFNHIKTNYDLDNNNDFKTIKKLFALNKQHYFLDFFGN